MYMHVSYNASGAGNCNIDDDDDDDDASVCVCVCVQTVELLLLIQYSGAGGLAAGYCRQCSLSLTIDILPVLYVTDWSASVGSRLPL